MSNSLSNGALSHDGPPALPSWEGVADPQVVPGASEYGKRYPRAYKLKVLRETDACTRPGELGKYLRSVGLTHTTLTCFRKQRAAGALGSPQPTQSKCKSTVEPAADLTRRLLELERENRKLRRQLEQAEAIIDVQKKVGSMGFLVGRGRAYPERRVWRSGSSRSVGIRGRSPLSAGSAR